MRILLVICTLLVLSQCDYFAGLELKKELVDGANLAI